jgi:hypothetical protein
MVTFLFLFYLLTGLVRPTHLLDKSAIKWLGMRCIHHISFLCSYFSPLIKSIAKRPNSDYVAILDDIEERDMFIAKLESRFLYLAADARSVIRSVRVFVSSVIN